ncbi:MAG: SpoIIE family protein phosphatase [Phycisphaerae bacterium]|nr:SpoIIE family protein phosphatase [Phycisphaerae bacterium]
MAVPTRIASHVSESSMAIEGMTWHGPTPLILVVDDQESNRDVLCRRLLRRGYRTREACDGTEALRMIKGEDYDLVILDVMMPGISGLAVLEQVRFTRSRADLPIIMATARDQSADIVEALRKGANDYVTKPIDFAVIIARVEMQLSLRNSVKQILTLERRLSQRNAELEAANHHLRSAALRAQRELELAAKVQSSLLPNLAPFINGIEFAWAFRPCNELAGDALNVFPLGPDHVGFYVLDVSGHGVAASLASVAATRALSPTGRDSMVLPAGAHQPIPPAAVLQRMEEQFPFREETEQFITMFYAVLDTTTQQLSYASAGHPPAIRIDINGAASVLDHSTLPIGLGGKHDQHTVQFGPGDRLFIYSDGVTEATNESDEEFGRHRLSDVLSQSRTQTLDESVRAAIERVESWRGQGIIRDDVSLLGAQIGIRGSVRS